MRLVYDKSQEEVKVGDKVTLSSGTEVTVANFRPPHKPAASGKVSVQYPEGHYAEYYVSVIGATWIEREDR